MVFGVSVDSYASNAEFRRQLGLPFDLLSDWKREVAKEYRCWNERMLVANRWSYLVDKSGRVAFAQHSGLNEPRDIEAMKAALDELHREQKEGSR